MAELAHRLPRCPARGACGVVSNLPNPPTSLPSGARALAEVAALQLASLGTAAAWRLGKWELLEGYLRVAEEGSPSALDPAEGWEVGVWADAVLAWMAQRGAAQAGEAWPGRRACECTVCSIW